MLFIARSTARRKHRIVPRAQELGRARVKTWQLLSLRSISKLVEWDSENICHSKFPSVLDPNGKKKLLKWITKRGRKEGYLWIQALQI